MSPQTRRSASRWSLVLAVSGLLCLPGCGGEGSEPGRGADPGADDRIRERAAALFTEDNKEAETARALEPLLQRRDPRPDDLVRGAIVHMALADYERAWSLIEQAHAATPDDARVLFVRGALQRLWTSDLEAAAESFRRVVEQHPEDAAARLQLAQTLRDLGQAEEAIAEYETVRAMGVEFVGSYYVTATYQLGQTLGRLQRREEALALLEEKGRLEAEGFKAAKDQDIDRGTLGNLFAPPLGAWPPGPPSSAVLPAWTGTVSVSPGHAGDGLALDDVDGDGRTDVATWGAGGLSLALQREAGRFTVVDAALGAVAFVTSGDLDDDGAPELLVVGADGVARLMALGGDGQLAALEADLPAGVVSGAFSDLDHDGDVDVVLAGSFGVAMLRNDGDRLLVDATPAPAASLAASVAVVPDDLDGDNDVDYLVVGAGKGALAILSNRRRGEFEDVSASWGLPSAAGAGGGDVALADLDLDARPDLVLRGAGGLGWHRNEGSRFAAGAPLPPAADGWLLADLDLDGHLDLLTGDGGAFPGPLCGRQGDIPRQDPTGVPEGRLAVGDVSGNGGRLDLVASRAGGVDVLASDGAAQGLTLELRGDKDNLRGVGAVVEVRSDDLYVRRYGRGPREVIGLGASGVAQIVRVTWPNGVVQHAFDLPAGSVERITQLDRVSGSCPFLYTWNGERFEFITDVLGATPLGLPMGPDLMVPFDHEEYVKIRGDQLAPRDGRLELALTEELREVTYLDRARLHVIDHPAGVDIEPDEAFVFPPFPPHHVHTLRDVLVPASAVADNGEDVTELVGARDDRSARPFTPLSAGGSGQYQGLCEPWALELEFGRDEHERAAIVAAPRLRLALTGWFQWGDASVNMAAARHPRHAFEVPVLLVPDGDGWKPVGPPIGFPAGKTKTMIVDLTDVLDRSDPRLRMETTLELSWDWIRLAVDGDDAPFSETVLEPLAADLSFRGFSELLETGRADLPELFDWDRRTASPPWNQHPGMYTRYGDVAPLLDAVDDRYVIMGAGDAALLTFDATDLPPLPEGWTRDYLLYLDGWAKDGDPNTRAAERVEPLPFHGMTSYPPPAGESFPDTPEHRAWKAGWNTRPARTLVAPLSRARTLFSGSR